MKFVNSIYGAVALHVAADEVVPQKGLILEDLISVLVGAYKFSVRPNIPKNIPPNLLLPYVFQSGSVTLDDNKFPIYQLIVLQQGEIVGGPTTDVADRVLADYMSRLDADLGYRFKEAKNKRVTYQSHVVVDFDAEIGRQIGALAKLETLLNREIKTLGAPFSVKRLSFGSVPTMAPGTMTLEAFERTDFVIERRIADIEVSNRYYSVAPVTTAEHVRLLEAIEQELAG